VTISTICSGIACSICRRGYASSCTRSNEEREINKSRVLQSVSGRSSYSSEEAPIHVCSRSTYETVEADYVIYFTTTAGPRHPLQQYVHQSWTKTTLTRKQRFYQGKVRLGGRFAENIEHAAQTIYASSNACPFHRQQEFLDKGVQYINQADDAQDVGGRTSDASFDDSARRQSQIRAHAQGVIDRASPENDDERRRGSSTRI
jgi:hypothetical protein